MNHLSRCNVSDVERLRSRLEKWGDVSISNNQLFEQYFEFILFNRNFYPPHWTDEHHNCNTTFHVVPFSSGEVRHFQFPRDCTLTRIERVQNKELYLRCLEYKNEHNTGKEATLFHGSQENNYNIICNQGFDVGHSRQGVWGYGLYFSSCMDYSRVYSRARLGGSGHAMLMCRVWLTDDSVVNVGNVHVVHSDFAAYPEYIIYYE